MSFILIFLQWSTVAYIGASSLPTENSLVPSMFFTETHRKAWVYEANRGFVLGWFTVQQDKASNNIALSD